MANSDRPDEAKSLLEQLRTQAEEPVRYPKAQFLADHLEFEMARARGDLDAVRAYSARFEAAGNRYSAAVARLAADDPGADVAFEAVLEAPAQNRLLNHLMLLALGPELRAHPLVERWQASQGFTDAWRRTLCARAAQMADVALIDCDVAQFQSASTPVEDTVVAVLPLVDTSDDGSLGWLVQGLGNEIRHQLANADGYRVHPGIDSNGDLPASVQLTLSGNVASASGAIEVELLLHDVREKREIWSERFASYDTNPLALFETLGTRVRSYFARSVADDGLFTAPRNPDAMEPFLAYVRTAFTGDVQRAQQALDQALEADPGWAHGYLNRAVNRIGSNRAFDVAMVRRDLDTAAELGLRNDPNWRLWHYNVRWIHEGEFRAAEAYLRSQPDNQWARYNYMMLMLNSGLYPEARRYVEYQAKTEAPDAANFWGDLATLRAFDGDLESAYEAAVQVERLGVAGEFNVWHLPYLYVLAHSGRHDEAETQLKHLERALDATPERFDLRWYRTMLRFELARSKGDRAQMRRLVDEADAAGLAGEWMYLALGDDDKAAELAAHYAARGPTLSRLQNAYFRLLWMPDLLGNPLDREFQDRWGFTREWQRELCGRVASFPEGYHLDCDPSDY